MAVKSLLLTLFTLVVLISNSRAFPAPGCHFLPACPKYEIDIIHWIFFTYCNDPPRLGTPGDVGTHKVETDLNYYFENVDGYLKAAQVHPGECMKSCGIVRPLENPGVLCTTVCRKLDGTSVESTINLDEHFGYDPEKRKLVPCSGKKP